MLTISYDKYRRMRKDWDCVLPPMEFKKLEFRAAGQVADWGHEYLKRGDLNTGNGKGVITFVLDTGIDEQHEDLKGNILPQYGIDFTGDGLGDEHGHGTHCASIIAAVNNGVGTIGIAHASKVAQVKVLNNNGGGSYNGIADGIRYVADLKLEKQHEGYVKQINLSLGGPADSEVLYNAVKYAIGKGVIIYAAAGNAGVKGEENTIGYPGRYKEVITVASIGVKEAPSKFSSQGEEVDLAAPGERTLAAIPGGYARMSGTSMATPAVAGVGACMISAHPNLWKPGQIINQMTMETFLRDYAKDLHETGFDIRTGAGAPIVSRYEGEAPTLPQPPKEEPKEIKPKRALLVRDLSSYDFKYKAAGEDELQAASINFVFEITTKLLAEAAGEALEKGLIWYLGNGRRQFWLLKNADIVDAAYWVQRFATRAIKEKFGLDIECVEANIKREFTQFRLTGKALKKPPGTYR